MEFKSKLTLAALICAGLFATGCSQQQAAGSQQTVASQQTACQPCDQAKPAPAPAKPAPVRPAPAPKRPVVPAPKVPQVKAKGNYKGAVQMDPASQATMQQYQR
ncbi:MAG TPA: hypothetical protein PLE99_02875 [Candidatus Thiothrix moscowensis]|uniref:hypothetical protein n=1 Tax=unclassified Thiothrix TaxID=2636184 RepID=UPI0025F30A82|nr:MULTISPECIES: hypothetical protein [unclassified Thiothrix]HRJ51685.1 hypothetical protein [Candidatus Thiothrix moscowensis]HRJ92000.1 hypothetical protein [Candidatus Thiothrix moscowensis]